MCKFFCRYFKVWSTRFPFQTSIVCLLITFLPILKAVEFPPLFWLRSNTRMLICRHPLQFRVTREHSWRCLGKYVHSIQLETLCLLQVKIVNEHWKVFFQMDGVGFYTVKWGQGSGFVTLKCKLRELSIEWVRDDLKRHMRIKMHDKRYC